MVENSWISIKVTTSEGNCEFHMEVKDDNEEVDLLDETIALNEG